MIRVLRIVARLTFVAVVLAALVGGGAVAVTLAHFGRDLPDYEQISHYVPAIGSKVYAEDGSLMAELATERRIFVPLQKIPPVIRRAFLAAEDRDFYTHNGVNPWAILRAGVTDLLRFHKGQRPMGASTITQQVVRHFLLTNEVSVARKIKEAILAYRIDKTLSKDKILEIYLNEIYFGAGAYGVAAAADTYFQKPLDQLSVAQVAFLAALPKAPNNYNPVRHAHAAKARRDWVLSGMADAGYISQDEAKAAAAEPLQVQLRTDPEPDRNGYFAEEVRRELVGRFGDKALYEGGLTIRTSYRADYQAMADTAFHNGLVDYDKRHGWRGPIAHHPTAAAAEAALATTNQRPGVPTWRIAAVTEIDQSGAQIALKGGGAGRIPFAEMKWARHTLSDQRVGGWLRGPRDVVAVGDIVLVEPIAAPTPAPTRRGAAPAPAPAVAHYTLRQIPDVSGGFVALDPHSGRVFATIGGWDFGQSQFNRATQAKRQPGSAFKPFVYLTALENGFSPSSVLDNSPIDLPQGPGLPAWHPVNYEGETSGPATLREALMHSYNLVTARLASMIGMPAIGKTVEAFDVMDRMPLYYSMALGAGETTLLRLATAYAMIDNGGHWLLPSLIDTVQDREGRIIYQKGVGSCAACFVAAGPATTTDANALYKPRRKPDAGSARVANARFADDAMVYYPNKPEPLVPPGADYQLISMMQDVVQHGTGIAVAAVGKPLAGKTGTTSDFFDAWFVGFSPDLVAGGYVGFDQPRTLGHGEAGGRVVAPIFRDFMMAALKNAPATPFPTAPDDDVAIADANPTASPTASATALASADSTGTSGSTTAQTATLRGGSDKTRAKNSRSGWSDDQARVDQVRVDQVRGDQAYTDPNDPYQDGSTGSTGYVAGQNQKPAARAYSYNDQGARYIEDPGTRAWQDPNTRASRQPARSSQDQAARANDEQPAAWRDQRPARAAEEPPGSWRDPISQASQAYSRAAQPPVARWQDQGSRYAQEQRAPYPAPAVPPSPQPAYAYPYPPQIYGYAPRGYGYAPPVPPVYPSVPVRAY